MTSTRVPLLLYFVVVAFRDKASPLSIVSSETFREGSPVTVTCNADAIDVDMGHDDDRILAVALLRRTYSSSNNNYLNPEELIFFYSASEYRAGESDYEEIACQDPDWTVDLPTGLERTDDKIFDRDVVSGVLTMQAASCSDAGRYICQVMHREYHPRNSIVEEEVQELNCTHD